MKTFFVAGMILLFSSIVNAQPPEGGPPKPPPAEKRWEKDSKKINEAVNFKDDQLAKAKTAFYSFYKSMDALREKFPQQRPPKEEFEKIKSTRNDEMKKILSAAQFEAFLKVEKELGPPKHKEGDVPPPPPNS